MKFLHKKCLNKIELLEDSIKLKNSEIESLNNKLTDHKKAIKDQGEEVSQLKIELKFAVQKLAFAEGQIQAIQELNETLKMQAQVEISRATKLETIVLQGYQTSTEKFNELTGNLFEEDPEIIQEFHNEYKDSEGAL